VTDRLARVTSKRATQQKNISQVWATRTQATAFLFFLFGCPTVLFLFTVLVRVLIVYELSVLNVCAAVHSSGNDRKYIKQLLPLFAALTLVLADHHHFYGIVYDALNLCA
jgi:flagellar biosynthesis protein FliP